ncbi:MAG: hypothetical protein IPK08_20465 [Bacteroidetes bacterium]|nr:hypothetical protein [Bacteroidota bacterium]
MTQTNDGGYILGGYSFSNISGDKTENSNGGNDYWIVKQIVLVIFNGRIQLEEVVMISFVPLLKPQMEGIFWEEIIRFQHFW